MNKAEILEVFACFGPRAVVQQSSLGDDSDLVVQLVNTVSSLVQANDGGVALDVGQLAKDLVEAQGGVGVETSRGVVPHLDARLARQYLGDGYPLLLAA